MRVPQKEGTKGSLKWMQRLAARMPHSIGSRLKQLVGLKESDHIDWLSPAPEDHAEFRDDAFLGQIGRPDLAPALADFWPKGGPQWDGIARCGDRIILVEAKAHIPEMKSNCAARLESLAKIQRALGDAKKNLGVPAEKDWTRGYYQYANRLAHLDFLVRSGVDAHLVFIYFYNADMSGPKTAEEWKPAIQAAHQALGLTKSPATDRVHDLFVDVGAAF